MMDVLRDIDMKRLGIMVGSIVLILALGFTTHFLFFRDETDSAKGDVTLEGVEQVVGPGKTDVTLTNNASESILKTTGFTLDIAEKLDGKWADVVQHEEIKNQSEINVKATIIELKKNITSYNGIFDRQELSGYTLGKESDQLFAHTSKLSEFYLLGQELTKFSDAQDVLLRTMREQQDGVLKSYGFITGNGTQGVYLINDSGFEGTGSIEAYLWGKKHIVRVTGLVVDSDTAFPEWLKTLTIS